MIAKLSHIIADFFIRQKVVPEEQREVYEYGFELSISSVIGILFVLAIGFVSNRFLGKRSFLHSVLFYKVIYRWISRLDLSSLQDNFCGSICSGFCRRLAA